MHSEQDFFPGSIQKKGFLSSLTKQILLNLEDASFPLLARSIKKSLDEKQLVIAFEDDKIQDAIDSLYWSGKTIIPACPADSECVTDYILPVDANLGVNKANFLVSRTISQRVRINGDGSINNVFITSFRNDSQNDVFPGGTYKNYFQLYLPKNAVIKNINKNGVQIEEFDERQNIFKTVGFFIEIPPTSQADIKIEYQLEDVIVKGRNVYQLVVQKQIGSKNSDINLELILPNNIKLLNQNFTPLVKDNRIFYNSGLTQDKIFLFELNRK
jgi:hypothetical protein